MRSKLYTIDDVQNVLVENERQGGAVLNERCVGVPLKYPIKKTSRTTQTRTCNCGEESMMVITYDPEKPEQAAKGAGFARICVNCDLAGHWERFSVL